MRRAFSFVLGTVAGIVAITLLEGRGGVIGSIAAKQGPAAGSAGHGRKPASRSGSSAAHRYPVTPETVAGALVNFGYGEISVQVEVAGGRITRVAVSRFKTLDSYSTQIGQYAIPVLGKEVLAAQGLPIRVISGATYTSEGYASSVYSALKKIKG